jgi:hypothetical protein
MELKKQTDHICGNVQSWICVEYRDQLTAVCLGSLLVVRGFWRVFEGSEVRRLAESLKPSQIDPEPARKHSSERAKLSLDNPQDSLLYAQSITFYNPKKASILDVRFSYLQEPVTGI